MKLKIVLSGFLLVLFSVLMTWQATYVLADEDTNPISSPITSASTPTPSPIQEPISSPISSPIVTTPTPTQTQQNSTATAPITSPSIISASDIISLINNIFIFHETSTGTNTIELSTNTVVTINTGSGSNVVLPTNTQISRVDGLIFDASTLSLAVVPVNTLGTPAEVTSIGALQWGLPGIGLQFSQAIQLQIVVGSAYNGQTLSVYRSVNGVNGWTIDGLSTTACTVSGGICTFLATKASYYIVGQAVAPVVNNSSNNNSNNNSNDSSGSTNSTASTACTASKPGSAPVLLSVKVTGANQVTLTWSKAKDPVSYYLVAYGLKSGKLEYGNPNVGGVNTTTIVINGLSGGTKYFFKVRAGNSCTPGEFSNEIAVTVGGSTISKPAVGFEKGVLATKSAELKITPTGVSQTISKQEITKKEQPSIFVRFANFIKSLFSK